MLRRVGWRAGVGLRRMASDGPATPTTSEVSVRCAVLKLETTLISVQEVFPCLELMEVMGEVVELTNGTNGGVESYSDASFAKRAIAVPRERINSSLVMTPTQSDGDAYAEKVGQEVNKQEGDAAAEHRLNDHLPKASTKQLKDEWCDPENPRKLQFADISAAAYNIRGGVVKTPMTKSKTLSAQLGMELYFKKEFLQDTGSFKERGARYTLLRLKKDPQKAKLGVVAASAGNHALALSFHGAQLGIPVTVVMPLVAPLMKINRCRTHGANIVVSGGDIGESRLTAMGMAEESGALYVNGYDHPDILAGQGTLGLEILDELPDVDAIVCPIGGAGLIAGLAKAVKYLKPDTLIIGAEGEMCPSFTNAIKEGRPTYTRPGSTLADGLNVPTVGVNAFETAKDLVDRTVLVSEEDIARSILQLVEIEKAVVEGAGAVGLAALLADKAPELKGKKVVVPLCGGNIDTTVLGRSIERGLAAEGRMVRFAVTVSDRPGGIAELATLLCKAGASIKDIFHERAWLKSDIFSVRVKVVAETRDWEHCHELEALLRAHYQELSFNLNTADIHLDLP